MTAKGQVITGEFGKIVIRQKSDINIELGELIIGDSGYDKLLMHVFDISYGSQISRQNLELMSGMKLEEENDLEFYEPKLRNYKLALAKSMLLIKNHATEASVSKTLPDFFSLVYEVKKEDLLFLTTPNNPLRIGKLRSGSKILDLDIFLEGDKVLSEHILVPATTGRGKSNLTKCIIWDTLGKDYCGMLVIDPHDEYYGRNELGMKDHPLAKTNVVYYSQNPPAGCLSLKISIRKIMPWHFNGVSLWSDAQAEAMNAYYKFYGDKWIEAVLLEKEIKNFQEGTLGVLKRRLLQMLNMEVHNCEIQANCVFSVNSGETTVNDIVDALEKAKTVIVDTSGLSSQAEILVGSIISTETLSRYRSYKTKGTLKDKPTLSIVLEEAPRVLGKEVLEKGSNIFAAIAREGRKFKVGLFAITQLPSLIPRQILANMNTKIILGIEMAPERQAVIDSASQDLSDDQRNIASLDKGEAIITSNFTKFAIPVKIPLFKRLVEETQNEFNREKYSDKSAKDVKKDYSGVRLG